MLTVVDLSATRQIRKSLIRSTLQKVIESPVCHFRKSATGMTSDILTKILTAKILAILIWPSNFTHGTAVKGLSYHHQLHVYFHLNFGKETKKTKRILRSFSKYLLVCFRYNSTKNCLKQSLTDIISKLLCINYLPP